MIGYQNLVSESTTVLFDFRLKCFNAFSNQREAIELFQAEEYQECLESMQRNKVNSPKDEGFYSAAIREVIFKNFRLEINRIHG